MQLENGKYVKVRIIHPVNYEICNIAVLSIDYI